MNAKRTRQLFGATMLAGVVFISASCGDVVTSSDSPVMLVLTSLTAGDAASAVLSSDVVSRVATPPPCTAASPCFFVVSDLASASVSVVMKDVTIAPTTNNSVTISRYHVEYRRADGNNRPGVDVPFAFDGASTLTIPAGASGTFPFELVRIAAKRESPLVELVSNTRFTLGVIADVTLYGTDVVGNAVSAHGSISINFANYGPF